MADPIPGGSARLLHLRSDPLACLSVTSSPSADEQIQLREFVLSRPSGPHDPAADRRRPSSRSYPVGWQEATAQPGQPRDSEAVAGFHEHSEAERSAIPKARPHPLDDVFSRRVMARDVLGADL